MISGERSPTWWSRLAGAAAYRAARPLGRTVEPDDPIAVARVAACLACDRCSVCTERTDPTRHVWACGVCRCIVAASPDPSEMEDPLEPHFTDDARPAIKALCLDSDCPHPEGSRWAPLTLRGARL